MNETLAVPAALSTELEGILRQLYQKANATAVLLADVSGQLIALEGEGELRDPVIVAALSGGQLAAIQELARQVGDPHPLGALFYEGEQKRIALLDVGGSFVLIVVFEPEIPMGLVRHYATRTVSALDALREEFEEWMRAAGPLFALQESEEEAGEPFDFNTALGDAFDDAFEGF
ncbi:MAG: roadblock/LC7 domain-containing protein [Anaerolineales bacterium]